MISKEKLDFAIKQVVDVCLKVKKGEKGVVITDNETKHIGLPIADKIKQVAGDVKIFMMEDFGLRSDDGTNPLQFPKEIGEALAMADVSVYAAGGLKGEFPSFRAPMLKYINSNKKLRHGHMIFVNDKIMEMGMSADYKKVMETTTNVLNIVSKAKRVTVTTAKGTNFSATFNPSWKWVATGGYVEPGHWSNLPEGEVYTTPKSVDGDVVVDGVLGDHFVAKLGVIEKTPLIIKLKEGYISSVSCSNKELEEEFKKYISNSENANRIGEFAIGTNIGLTELIGNLLQDEKFPGIHIAAGDGYPEKTGADWSAKTHLDMVIQKTTIDVDGRIIMKEGKFLI